MGELISFAAAPRRENGLRKMADLLCREWQFLQRWRIARLPPPPIDPSNFDFSFPPFLHSAREMISSFRERFGAEGVSAAVEAADAALRREPEPNPLPALARARPDAAARAIRRLAAGQRMALRDSLSCAEFIPLAKAWLLSGEERFAEAVAERAKTWDEANPAHAGPAWADAFEAGERLANWTLAFGLLRGARALDEPAQKRALRVAYRHARWIELRGAGVRPPECRIATAAALALAGTQLCLFDRAEDWKDLGLRRLLDLARRWLPEFAARRNAHALSVSLEWLLLAYAAAKSKRVALPVSLLETMERAAHALLAGGLETEDPAQGARIRFATHESAKRFIANAMAVARHSPDLKALGGGLDERTFWLLGPAGAQKYDSI